MSIERKRNVLVSIEQFEARRDADRYMMARGILANLKSCYARHEITAQQYRTLRGAALAGDVAGAQKGLKRLLMRRSGGALDD